MDQNHSFSLKQQSKDQVKECILEKGRKNTGDENVDCRRPPSFKTLENEASNSFRESSPVSELFYLSISQVYVVM